MDFFHSHTKIVSRNKGRSAVATSAYISGTKMENTWDGVTHDYTCKQHVIHTEVMLPAHAPPEYADRNLLWNSIEWNETKANAQLARSIELSLPAELNHEQNIALIRKYVQENFVDKGMCADVAFHDKNDGNPHVHILLTMRPLTADGKWGTKAGWNISLTLMATVFRQNKKDDGRRAKFSSPIGTTGETQNDGELPPLKP